MSDHATRCGKAPGRRCGTLLNVCLIAALIAGTAIPPPSEAQEDTQSIDFNIAAQLLESALVQFGAQARIQIAAADADISGLKTDGVSGRRAVEEALAQLLRGTGLEYRKISERTYRVSRALPRSAAGKRTSANTYQEQRQGRDDAATPGMPDPLRTAATGQPKPGEDPKDRWLDEVVVTGTHIRGDVPTGAKLIVIDREDIDRSGFATVQDVVRSLPQSFGGGVSEDTRLGLEAGTNSSFATAINLRGLGAGSTLALLNGRRLAPGGTEGVFTDISSIPLTAIERVEVLPDGASALYGSEAVGGVVNFITRKDYSGAETQLRIGSVTDGGTLEYQIGQLFGTNWDSGGGLLSLEYLDRESLARAKRWQTSVSDLRPFGGSNFDNTNDNPGTIQIGTRTWAIPRGQDGRSLTSASFAEGTINFGNRNEASDLLPSHERWSAFGTLHQELGSRLRLSAEGLFTKRDSHRRAPPVPMTLTVPVTNGFYVNPTGGTGPIRVNYNFVDDLGPVTTDVEVKAANYSVGAAIDLSSSWQLSVHTGYGSEDQLQTQDGLVNTSALGAALADPNRDTAFNAFGDGSHTNATTLASIRDFSRFETESEISSGGFVAEGPIFALPAGALRAALGVDYREQEFQSTFRPVGGGLRSTAFDRNVAAVFGEARVPLFQSDMAIRGISSLDLALAGRFEDYSDFGSTTVPKVGLVWAPIAAIAIRGTWSKSFKAPNLADLNESTNGSFISPLPDPSSPAGFSPALIWFGKNAGLQEETAKTWTAGVQVKPGDEDFLVDLTYFDIEFENRAQQLPFSALLLQDPRFASVVTRNPSSAQRETVCQNGRFVGAPADCRGAPIAAIVDLRVNNVAATMTRGVDVQVTYGVDSHAGLFDFGLTGTYLMDFAQAQLQSSPLVDLVDTESNPIDLRLRGSIGWKYHAFRVSGIVNYSDGYTDTASEPDRRVRAWTTVDLRLEYATDDDGASWLQGTTLALNAQNVLDQGPPFVNNAVGVAYDPENADLLRRFVSVQLRKAW